MSGVDTRQLKRYKTIEKVQDKDKDKDRDKDVKTSAKEGGVPTRHAWLVLDNIKRAVCLHLKIF